MNVLITLTSAGTDTGPFNLYSNVDNYTTAFETNISRGILVAGYTSTIVPPGTTAIRVKSMGVCSNYVDITITTPSTTTTTTTANAATTSTTTTAAPVITTSTTTTSGGGGGTTTTTTTPAPVPTTTTTTTYVGPATTTTTTTAPVTTTTTSTSTTILGTTTTTSTSSTTSTTTTSAFEYYLADEFLCSTCIANATGVLVKVPVGSALIPNRFYKSFDVSNFTYQITDTGQAPGTAITLSTVSSTTCSISCSGVTTTTTTSSTTTAAPILYYEYTLCTDFGVKYYTTTSSFGSQILIAGQCFSANGTTYTPTGTEFFAIDGSCSCV